MEIYPKNRYESGTYKTTGDVSGFDHLRSELVERWDGALVHPKNNDPTPKRNKPRKKLTERQLRFD